MYFCSTVKSKGLYRSAITYYCRARDSDGASYRILHGHGHAKFTARFISNPITQTFISLHAIVYSKDVWKLKKAIVISAVILISLFAIIAILSRNQPTQPQPTQKTLTRVNLTDSYLIAKEKYLILDNGHAIYYNVELTIKIYAFDSTVTTRTLKFNQTETLHNISYTYGIILPNISARQIDIISITGETFI